MIRDYQRTKVWRAFWEWEKTTPQQCMDFDELKNIVHHEMHEANKYSHVRISNGRGARQSYWWTEQEGKEIVFQFPWKRRQPWVLCRVLASAIAGEESGHDWYFCRRMLRLVREYMGPHEAASLLAAFQKQEVKLTEHRKERWRKPFRFSDPANRIR